MINEAAIQKLAAGLLTGVGMLVSSASVLLSSCVLPDKAAAPTAPTATSKKAPAQQPAASQKMPVGTMIGCHVVGIADGDTLTCLTAEKTQLKVRLHQIDAPEKGQAYGNAARKELSDLVFNQDVQLRTAGTDRYQRVLAEVLRNGSNVNQLMVQRGYAWAYREYLKDHLYLVLEEQARIARRGLWADPAPVNPAEFRQLQREK